MHLTKYTKSEMIGISRHNSRTTVGHHSNEQINVERSELNYNLATHQSMPDMAFINKRLSEIHNTGRKTLNVACNWVVQLPEAINIEQQEEFFKTAYKFLAERYGKENVISAYVHLDETTPHMHFSFTPVRFDKEKDMYKFDAKNVISRSELRTCQRTMDQTILDKFNLEPGQGLLNGATAGGNRTVIELKTEQKEAELEDVVEGLNIAQNLLSKKQTEIGQVKNTLYTLESKIRVNEKFLQQLELHDLQLDLKEKKNIVQLPKEQFDTLVEGYQNYKNLGRQFTRVQSDKVDLEFQVSRLRNKDYIKENDALRRENADLRLENEELNRDNENLNSIVTKIFDFFKMIEQKFDLDLNSMFNKFNKNKTQSRSL